MSSQQLPDVATMTQAYLSRNSDYDGVFFTGVQTTGIFCRPICKAKSPLPKNVKFFATGPDAIHAGFRPCKMCRPMDRAGEAPPWIKPVLDAVDSAPSHRWKDEELLQLGVDPVRARRWFKNKIFHLRSQSINGTPNTWWSTCSYTLSTGRI